MASQSCSSASGLKALRIRRCGDRQRRPLGHLSRPRQVNDEERSLVPKHDVIRIGPGHDRLQGSPEEDMVWCELSLELGFQLAGTLSVARCVYPRHLTCSG